MGSFSVPSVCSITSWRAANAERFGSSWSGDVFVFLCLTAFACLSIACQVNQRLAQSSFKLDHYLPESMTTQPQARKVIVGVDTHKHVHVAVAIDTWGIRLGDQSFVADSGGYQALITWAECSAPGFLDSGLTVFASMLPRPARRSHVAPERGFDSGTSLASTARCTSA